MRIILIDNVTNLGKFGDILNVKNGYARNFLIPKKKAKIATYNNLMEIKKKKTKTKNNIKNKIKKSKKIFKILSKITIKFHKKSSIEGILFGSITKADIQQKLIKKGIEINKDQIYLKKNSIKKIGKFYIKIKLYKNIKTLVPINVLSN